MSRKALRPSSAAKRTISPGRAFESSASAAAGVSVGSFSRAICAGIATNHRSLRLLAGRKDHGNLIQSMDGVIDSDPNSFAPTVPLTPTRPPSRTETQTAPLFQLYLRAAERIQREYLACFAPSAKRLPNYHAFLGHPCISHPGMLCPPNRVGSSRLIGHRQRT